MSENTNKSSMSEEVIHQMKKDVKRVLNTQDESKNPIYHNCDKIGQVSKRKENR